MAHESKRGRILRTTLELAAAHGRPVHVDEVSIALGLGDRLSHKRLCNTLSELTLAGRLRRVDKGLYERPDGPKTPDKKECMWRLLRMRRVLTVADLQEMADVSRDYALEWLRLCVRQGLAAKTQRPNEPATWRLVAAVEAEAPVNAEKAERLRALRRRKKEMLVAGIEEVRRGLSTLAEGLALEGESD
jgi:hypothetical protein